MRDSRLLGVWKSDKRKTMRELRARADIPDKKLRDIAAQLGKLELRFTASLCYSTLGDQTLSAPYSIVAKDSSSVAIVSRDARFGEETITHVHFDGASFWVTAGSGSAREFFTRDAASAKPAAAKSAAAKTAAVKTVAAKRALSKRKTA
jgi:hypothetical protein